MELDTNTFDWAQDAFLALNDSDANSASKWTQFSNPTQTLPPSAFTIPPGLATQASIERFGQITPPDELSPAAARNDYAREHSIPVERLRNEVPWPVEQQMQALADYKPSPLQSDTQTEEAAARGTKRRRTSKPANQSESPTVPAPAPQDQQQTTPADAQPAKRKRGRPKSVPQTVAYTTDGFPFQVSSARESHLEKNRVAAHKCRQRKKEWVNGLEDRAREYSSKNKALKENVAILREEVLELKNEVLRHAGCGFWAVDEYLARCAGDLLRMQSPSLPFSRKPSQTKSPTLAELHQSKERRNSTLATTPSQGTTDSQDEELEGYGGLDLIRDFDENNAES